MANRKVSPLTDTEIKNAKSRDKEYSLPDGNGLQLIVKPDGRKVWEIRYTVDGKPKKTTAGTYPSVALSKVRLKRDELKSKVLNGIDPIQEKKEIKATLITEKEAIKALDASQLHLIAYEWLSTLKGAESTAIKRQKAFERGILIHFSTYDKNNRITSSQPMGEITHGELLKIITNKGKTHKETAERLFADCKRLWTYAVSHDYIDINITDKIDKSVIPKGEEKHYAKITDEKILGELMRAIDVYKGDGGVIVRNLLRFVALVPLRASNLCLLKWENVDFEKAIITIPRYDMKIKDKNLQAFILPLSLQAIAILKEVHAITSWGVWVFHGMKNIHHHVNKESGNKALRLMGFTDEDQGRKQTLHSFRGTFRSLSETYATEHNVSFEARERSLDHHEKNKAVRAYTHKADYTEQIRTLLQWWADYLDVTKQQKEGK